MRFNETCAIFGHLENAGQFIVVTAEKSIKTTSWLVVSEIKEKRIRKNR